MGLGGGLGGEMVYVKGMAIEAVEKLAAGENGVLRAMFVILASMFDHNVTN